MSRPIKSYGHPGEKHFKRKMIVEEIYLKDEKAVSIDHPEIPINNMTTIDRVRVNGIWFKKEVDSTAKRA